MSTRLPTEVTDPSFRLGLSTTVQQPGATGATGVTGAPATGAHALPDDDEPTARTMLANFGEPAERPAMQGAESPNRPSQAQLGLDGQHAHDNKINKSDDRRKAEVEKKSKQELNLKLQAQKNEKQKLNQKLDVEKAAKQRLNNKLNVQSDKARGQRNRSSILGAEVDRAKRKKLDVAYAVEAKNKKLLNREGIFIEDKKRAMKVQEGNKAAAKGAAASSAIRSAAVKGVHPNSVAPNAARPAEQAPSAAPAVGIAAGDAPAAAVGGGGSEGGGGTGGGLTSR